MAFCRENVRLSASKLFFPGVTLGLLFWTENVGLSASKATPVVGTPLTTVNAGLSASKFCCPPGPELFRTTKDAVSASPSNDGIAGMLFGSSGSVPKNASTTSWNPSPSVSAREVGSTMVKRFTGVIAVLELPAIFVATSAKVPNTLGGTETVSVAEVPVGSMELPGTVMAGVDAGENENLEPPSVVPVMWKVTCVPASADLRLMKVITGT